MIIFGFKTQIRLILALMKTIKCGRNILEKNWRKLAINFFVKQSVELFHAPFAVCFVKINEKQRCHTKTTSDEYLDQNQKKFTWNIVYESYANFDQNWGISQQFRRLKKIVRQFFSSTPITAPATPTRFTVGVWSCSNLYNNFDAHNVCIFVFE